MISCKCIAICGVRGRTLRVDCVSEALELAIARFLSEHPDALVKCNPTPALYEYCQEHYEIAWNSGTKQFSEYAAAPCTDSLG